MFQEKELYARIWYKAGQNEMSGKLRVFTAKVSEFSQQIPLRVLILVLFSAV